MSEHKKPQPERSAEVAPDELSDADLTTVAGGLQMHPAAPKAGFQLEMETVTMTHEFKAKK